MGGFANPIIGGGGALVYPAIKSPNFVHLVSGWSIDKNGNAEFNSVIIPSGSGGARIFVQATAPASPHTGDLWVQTSSGNEVAQWSGSAWVSFQWGTGSIQAGAITAALIAANTITAAKIAAGTITATQIASGTITAAKLAAGIVVAGIVDATTITGATIIADGTSGQFLIYSGTPASGNLAASASGSAGTDSHGNSYLEGVAVYDNSTGNTGQLDAGQVNVSNDAAGGSGSLIWTAASLSGTGGSGRNIAEILATDTSTLETIIDVIAPTGSDQGAVAIFGWEPTGAVELEILASLLGGLSISGTGGQQLVLTSTSTPGSPISQIAAAASGNEAFGISVTGDANDRLLVDSAGKINWGNGTNAVDTNLYRKTAGKLQTDGNLEVGGTLTADGIAALTAGSDTSAGVTVRTPGLANGTPGQLGDTTRDYMVYLQIGTPGTSFSLKIGAGNPPGNTIYTSATPPAGLLLSFRLPAGWFIAWNGTGTTLASQRAVSC